MNTERICNSNVKVLVLDTIPEQGDELFSLGTYPQIVLGGEVDINYASMDPSFSHSFGPKSALGVKGTQTVLVQVEAGEDSVGVTARQLAQIVIGLGITRAGISDWGLIDLYHQVTGEIYQPTSDLTEIIRFESSDEDKPKKKKASKGGEQ